MKTVSFSFDTEEERAEFAEYARQKGTTLSALAKMALYQYRAKYPHKGTRKRQNGIDCEDRHVVRKTVQPYEPTVNGEVGSE
jgi:hypothetical protein